jgi:hypothetical protein
MFGSHVSETCVAAKQLTVEKNRKFSVKRINQKREEDLNRYLNEFPTITCVSFSLHWITS